MNKNITTHALSVHHCVVAKDLLYLHNRTVIYLPCPENVVDQAEQDHTNGSNNTEIHRLNRDNPRWRPEGEENSDGHVNECEAVDQDTPDTRQVEWSPHKLRTDSVDNLGVTASDIADATGAATVEE